MAGRDWRVRDDVHSHNDHSFITYKIGPAQQNPPPLNPSVVWSRKRIDKGKLLAYIQDHVNTPITTHHQLHIVLAAASDFCMPRHRPSAGRRPMYWWTNDIAEARKACIKGYRALKRKVRDHGTHGAQDERTTYKERKKELRGLIRSSKERA